MSDTEVSIFNHASHRPTKIESVWLEGLSRPCKVTYYTFYSDVGEKQLTVKHFEGLSDEDFHYSWGS